MLSGYSARSSSGAISLNTPNAGSSGISGQVSFASGTSSSGNTGQITLTTGTTEPTNGGNHGRGGHIIQLVGTGNSGDGGHITLTAGETTQKAFSGGKVIISGGKGSDDGSSDGEKSSRRTL